MGGKRDQLAVNFPHANARKRPLKGKFADVKCRRRSVHGQHVAVILQVAGDHKRLHLDFVLETVGPQWPDGAIHQTRTERLFGAGTSFAFEEATREFSGRRQPLAVVAHQGEKVEPRPGVTGSGRHQHHRLAVLHQHTAGRLLGKLPRFKGERLTANLLFYTYLFFSHFR